MADPVTYRPGIDDLGDAPAGGADNALPAGDNAEPADPVRSEADFRRAVLTLLTEIRDALTEEEP